MSWYATKSAGGQGLVVDSDGTVVALVYDPKDTPVMAAAPDLLDACEAALKQGLYRPDNPTYDDGHDTVVRNMIVAAIRKAKGD